MITRGTTILGYRVLQKFGDGGMSKVYLAEDPSAKKKNNKNRLVIIKIIEKEIVASNSERDIKAAEDQWKKAIDEFKITWSLFQNPHKNVVQPIKWDSDESRVVIVSEYIDGPSLNKLIDEYKALTIDRAVFYFKEICNGVRHFHKLNDKRTIIHRDLKLENIILTKDYREIKIIDYGIATSFYDNNIDSSEGTIYCTADYTTPDVLDLTQKTVRDALSGDTAAKNRMNKIISPQFDFHALGVILYYMITGNLPFNYDKNKIKDVDIIRFWKTFDLPIISNSISNVPNSIENIIFRCTASKPEDIKFRYKDIDELIADLATWNNEERKNEPLLKPINKRKFQQQLIFDIEREKAKEKFYEKTWFYVVVTISVFFVLVVILIVLILYYLKVGGLFGN